ncbi:MAG: hypothetical protein RIC85_00870 [Gammaproteobacteria bacterium]
MLHPKQFAINEAWVVFRLNDAPITTEEDGDFNVLALMDAGSCYIVGNQFVPSDRLGPSKAQAAELLEQGRSQKDELPEKLYVPTELEVPALIEEAASVGIEVVRVAEVELEIYTGEAREGFREHIGKDALH